MNKAALLASALLAVTPLPALAEPVLLISIDGLRPGDVLEADKRPVSAVADHTETRSVTCVDVEQAPELQGVADVAVPAGEHLVVVAVELDEQRAGRLHQPGGDLGDELLARLGPPEADDEVLG